MPTSNCLPTRPAAASASAAEAAAQAAADAASLAGEVRHLASWCEQVDAAHANHEERLRRLEAAEAGTARPALERAGSSPGGARELSPRLEQLEGALQEQDARLGRLEAAASAVAPPAGPGTVRSPGASPDAGAAAAAAGAVPGAPSLTAVHSRLGQLEGALAEVGQQATQQAARLEEVAAAQAQQGRGTEELLHSMLTDVMALARHTKVSAAGRGADLRSLLAFESRCGTGGAGLGTLSDLQVQGAKYEGGVLKKGSQIPPRPYATAVPCHQRLTGLLLIAAAAFSPPRRAGS